VTKYRVTIHETAVYEIEVEADDEDGAAEAAEEAFVQSEDPNEFFQFVKDRDAKKIEEMTDEQSQAT
jgi:hypothetical protein